MNAFFKKAFLLLLAMIVNGFAQQDTTNHIPPVKCKDNIIEQSGAEIGSAKLIFSKSKFKAQNVLITSIERRDNNLQVEFNGDWTFVPGPRVKSERNCFILRAESPRQNARLSKIETSLRSYLHKKTSFEIVTESAWASRGGVPMILMNRAELSILR